MPKIPSSYSGEQGIVERLAGQPGDDLRTVLVGLVDDVAALTAALNQHITDGKHRAATAVDAATALAPAPRTTK